MLGEGHMPKLDPIEVIGYYRALGEFVDTFANIEEVIFLYLSELAGVDHDTARAVFSGVRIHDAISFIKRIAEVRGVQLSAELDDVLGQLQIINDVRNLILASSGVGEMAQRSSRAIHFQCWPRLDRRANQGDPYLSCHTYGYAI
jgi:hypothetical protein